LLAETAPCCLPAGTMRGAVEAGQLGEAWGPSNKSYYSEIEEHKKMFVVIYMILTLTEFLLRVSNAAHQK